MSKSVQDAPRCFIYGLVDPDTRLVFYVGQTIGGIARPLSHRRRGWIFEVAILERVDEPKVTTASLCPWLPDGRNPTLLNELERYWIAFGRALGWPLRNQLAGGEGSSGHTPELLAHLRAVHRGKQHSAESRAKISAAIKSRMQDPTANVGNVGNRLKRNPAPKPKVVQPKVKRSPSKALREAQAARRRGKHWSAEMKAKISASFKANVSAMAALLERNRQRRVSLSHCKNGHARIPANLRRLRNGKLRCRLCEATHCRNYRARRKLVPEASTSES